MPKFEVIIKHQIIVNEVLVIESNSITDAMDSVRESIKKNNNPILGLGNEKPVEYTVALKAISEIKGEGT